MKCHFFVGLPGSGKSYLTEKIIKDNPDIVVLSIDNILERYAKKENKSYREIWSSYIKIAEKEFNDTLDDAIKNKKDILWDQTNLTSESRAKKLPKLIENGYEIDAVAIELSFDEWMRRIEHREANGGKTMPKAVLEDMAKSYQSPNYQEGFSNILLVNDDNNISLKNKGKLNLKVSQDSNNKNKFKLN